jgi:hypothetical protein
MGSVAPAQLQVVQAFMSVCPYRFCQGWVMDIHKDHASRKGLIKIAILLKVYVLIIAL